MCANPARKRRLGETLLFTSGSRRCCSPVDVSANLNDDPRRRAARFGRARSERTEGHLLTHPPGDNPDYITKPAQRHAGRGDVRRASGWTALGPQRSCQDPDEPRAHQTQRSSSVGGVSPDSTGQGRQFVAGKKMSDHCGPHTVLSAATTRIRLAVAFLHGWKFRPPTGQLRFDSRRKRAGESVLGQKARRAPIRGRAGGRWRGGPSHLGCTWAPFRQRCGRAEAAPVRVGSRGPEQSAAGVAN